MIFIKDKAVILADGTLGKKEKWAVLEKRSSITKRIIKSSGKNIRFSIGRARKLNDFKIEFR